MFVQVIQGRVDDAEALHSALDEWYRDLAPGASGWLGSTVGVSDDGQFVATARFESQEAARRNSERPEQDQWWSRTAGLFSGDPVFHEGTDVDVDLGGDPDQAGFVQVMQGRSSDPERARRLMADNPEAWAQFRPDVLGSLTLSHDGDAYTAVLYFTSEEAAREGEKKEPPPELKQQMEEMGSMSVGETTFIDLRHPWLYAPKHAAASAGA